MSPIQDNSPATEKIALNRPASGQAVNIALEQGVVLVFAFDPKDAVLTAHGEDLRIDFADGGSITVTGFFEGGVPALPRIELADGTEHSGLDFLARFEPRLLEVATSEAPGESGLPAYNDDPGNLIAGVDRLGSLGTDYWGRSSAPDLI